MKTDTTKYQATLNRACRLAAAARAESHPRQKTLMLARTLGARLSMRRLAKHTAARLNTPEAAGAAAAVGKVVDAIAENLGVAVTGADLQNGPEPDFKAAMGRLPALAEGLEAFAKVAGVDASELPSVEALGELLTAADVDGAAELLAALREAVGLPPAPSLDVPVEQLRQRARGGCRRSALALGDLAACRAALSTSDRERAERMGLDARLVALRGSLGVLSTPRPRVSLRRIAFGRSIRIA